MMETRAVVHADLRPYNYGKDVWIATHWDGYPQSLGKNLQEALDNEVKDYKKVFKKKDVKDFDWGSIIQKAVVKASANHHIDEMSTDGKKEFDERYGDWAEYEYDISVNKKTGKVIIKFRPRAGAWHEATIGKWKMLTAKKKLEKMM